MAGCWSTIKFWLKYIPLQALKYQNNKNYANAGYKYIVLRKVKYQELKYQNNKNPANAGYKLQYIVLRKLKYQVLD